MRSPSLAHLTPSNTPWSLCCLTFNFHTCRFVLVGQKIIIIMKIIFWLVSCCVSISDYSKWCLRWLVVLSEMMCCMFGFSLWNLTNNVVSRVVGRFVTAAHQPAESNGHSQPVATAWHMAEFHRWSWRFLSADGAYRYIVQSQLLSHYRARFGFWRKYDTDIWALLSIIKHPCIFCLLHDICCSNFVILSIWLSCLVFFCLTESVWLDILSNFVDLLAALLFPRSYTKLDFKLKVEKLPEKLS